MEWISVKEKRPSWHCILKVKRENGSECQAYYWKDGAAWLGFFFPEPNSYSSFQSCETNKFLFDVTHWKLREKDNRMDQR